MSEEQGKLLLISDIEGCAAVDFFSKTPQNVEMCTHEFFESIKAFLKKNTKNEVAFLGDYFDKGSGVVTTITSIVNLKKEFEDPDKDRVHIIFGNRDINKFRLAYELKGLFEIPKAGWTLWSGFYSSYNSYNSYAPTDKIFERFDTILGNSMGAGLPQGSLIDPDLITAIDGQKIGAYYLSKVFDNSLEPKDFGIADDQIDESLRTKLDKFILDCKEFFKMGNIVEYIKEFNTLLSHAGGISPAIYQYQIPVPEFTDGNYFQNIENYRKLLQLEGVVNESTTPFDSAIYEHRKLYSDFVTEFFGEPTNALHKHIMLQAMGLKPDDDDKPFISFIDSCIHIGSKPCSGHKRDEQIAFDVLGGKNVAHGHVPHCTTVPLIFKRQNVVFISCDTSNGYRPSKSPTFLAFVSNNEFGIMVYKPDVGIMVCNPGLGEVPSTYGKDNKSENVYNALLNVWNADNLPIYENNDIIYDGIRLRTKGALNPRMFEPIVTDVSGGKKRTMKKRKTKRKNRRNRKTKKKMCRHFNCK